MFIFSAVVFDVPTFQNYTPPSRRINILTRPYRFRSFEFLLPHVFTHLRAYFCYRRFQRPHSRQHAYLVAFGRILIVRMHRRRTSEFHTDMGPGQEERAIRRLCSGRGRMQIDGHSHLHLQTGPGEGWKFEKYNNPKIVLLLVVLQYFVDFRFWTFRKNLILYWFSYDVCIFFSRPCLTFLPEMLLQKRH